MLTQTQSCLFRFSKCLHILEVKVNGLQFKNPSVCLNHVIRWMTYGMSYTQEVYPPFKVQLKMFT